ncbi:hypothetical protein Adt_05654 [Abeliophyllum distichum]|uniref:Uncharacterized protein n=1 Tax=Abeliophyllum distichum TaxID=126358 RepID=A0ABD1V4R8_9LAMI
MLLSWSPALQEQPKSNLGCREHGISHLSRRYRKSRKRFGLLLFKLSTDDHIKIGRSEEVELKGHWASKGASALDGKTLTLLHFPTRKETTLHFPSSSFSFLRSLPLQL